MGAAFQDFAGDGPVPPVPVATGAAGAAPEHAPESASLPDPENMPDPPRGRRRIRPLLGEVLRERGALSEADLAHALDLKAREEARLGDILLANGMVSHADLYDALAFQYSCMIADLGAEPPDVRLIDRLGADFCIRNGVVPWKRAGGATVIICSRPDEFPRLVQNFPAEFGPVRLAIAAEEDIQNALIAARHRALAVKAETTVTAAESCRSWNRGRIGRLAGALIIALIALFVWSPLAGFALLTAWGVATLVLNSALKVAAAVIHLKRRKQREPTILTQRRAPEIDLLPTVSILVPLYHEREIAGRLVQRLEQLDYPRELLDICLVVEQDDRTTKATLAAADLPRWMRQITVPRGAVQTKPRAMNFALDFCRGSIIGVYDAEDAPDPDQIRRVVHRFHERGQNVACLQGILDFYNSRTNWLSRCFTVEYATWFRVILPGLERLGFVIPLGGTTLFFRRAALEELGGWDAYNVTEDADLGVRLARHGYRTETLDTVTEEEANCRAWPWVKQRSRWLKGYAMTYGVHMRDPRRLVRDLGWWRFLGVQITFLGSLSQVALAPLLWSFWALPLGLAHPLAGLMPLPVLLALSALFVLSEIITIGVGLIAVSDAKHRHLRAWVPTLHLYFPLATLAAAKGFWEILTRPFYWDKTRHGLFDLNEAASPGPKTDPEPAIPR